MYNSFVLVLAALALTSPTISAWMQMSNRIPLTSTAIKSPSSYDFLRLSSRVSGFGGQVVAVYGPSDDVVASTSSSSSALLQMKKGKSNVPPMMRKQYERQKEMIEMRKQMIESSKPGADGLPIFNLYVRSKKTKLWYPCGSFKGDDRSAGLAKNYADKNLLAGISKSQLDNGISGSIFKDLAKLTDSIGRSYPQLRKSKDDLEWGYRLGFAGLDEQKEPIVIVEPKEQKGIFDNIKGIFGG